MRVEITEAVWLDESVQLSLAELSQFSGLSEAELTHLIESDALGPSGPLAGAFDAHCLAVARIACRLRDDFELDVDGLALVLSLLDRIRGLESEVRDLQAKLPRRTR
jgi:chaperone modulatory protein CbpM